MEFKSRTEESIIKAFQKKFESEQKIKNAYLLVESDRLDIHLSLAAGRTGDMKADPRQPNYIASLAKIFTATLIGMLKEEDRLDYEDSIAEYLDAEIVDGLHIYRGKEYSEEIKIKHLLQHSSGLKDCFPSLLDRLVREDNFTPSPPETIKWCSENLEPDFKPGRGFNYSDTNYYLLGLILENITGRPFPGFLHDKIFDPLNMNDSFMWELSRPANTRRLPVADAYINDVHINELDGYGQVDFAAGGIVAPMGDLLKFMKALRKGQLIEQETLAEMKQDKKQLAPGIDYGYSIWQIKTIPLVMPAKYNSWGVVGVTGAYMFYHPSTESYIMGTFNDSSQEQKCLRFMMYGVMKNILKYSD